MVKDTRKIKQTKIVNEDVEQVKKLVILLLIVIVLCVGVYFLTEKLLDRKNKSNYEETNTEVKFNYDIATIGTMFNRPESEYYVFIYSTEKDGSKYDSMLTKYRSSDEYVKTYFIDLDLKANESILKEELNKKPTKSTEVSVKGATLYKLKNSKVIECYDTFEDIKNILN